MQLSKHFSLAEMTVTLHREIDNAPTPQVAETLRITAERMESVRHILGDRVITVSSAYRCPQLNRVVGGAAFSAHLTGYAVDFNCFSYGRPLDVCRALVAADIDFDQLIEEGTWVHISFDPRMRRQVLTKAGMGYRAGLPSK